MDKRKQDIAYFVSFCIEQYKNAKGLTGAEAAKELDYYGVLEYLEEHYDVLHTQSHQWILEDIDEFINIREKEGYQLWKKSPKATFICSCHQRWRGWPNGFQKTRMSASWRR